MIPGAHPAAILDALPLARGYELARVSIGRSGSPVYRLATPGKPVMYLKVSNPEEASELEAEHDRLQWLAGRTTVPRVLDFVTRHGHAYLLTEALAGTSAEEAQARHWAGIAEQMAVQLRGLHALGTGDCPFDRTLDRVIPLAAARAAAGCVDGSDFDAERLGVSAMELIDSLTRKRPDSEDLVVTHGDACLSNVVFDEDRFSGFVDCGRCGRADRHQDLALAHRSIRSHFGSRIAGDFLDAYGLARVDTGKLAFYRSLDEFF